MTQQILLPAVRVVYDYTNNLLTAYSASGCRSQRCLSTDIATEALQLASAVAGRPVSAVVANADNFLFR